MQDDRALVGRILDGDQRAFATLVHRHQRLVEHLVGRLVREPADRADVCQEVFLAVHRHLARFGFESQLSTWIGRIAWNAALTHLRRSGSGIVTESLHGTDPEGEAQDLLESEADPDARDPLAEADGADLRRVLEPLIAALPADQRAAVTLFHLHGMTVEEVGEVIGAPPNTVKSHLFRARKALKQHLLARHDVEALLS